MLGEQIGEFRGKLTGQRVLPSEGEAPEMEISLQETGKILGIDVNNSLTFVNIMRPGGLLYAVGNIIMMTRDGDVASGELAGIIKMAGRGMASTSRGTVYLQTPSSKLARLNSVVGLWEAEQDENGNTQVKLWEWK